MVSKKFGMMIRQLTVEDENQLIKSHQRKPEQVDIGIEGI